MPEHAGAIYLYSGTAAAPASDSVSNEERLMERACAGDEEAFNDIYRSYAPMVHGILLARVPYDDVKDVMQEVFLSAYKNLGTVRDAKALGGWIARIARNRAVEHYRSAKPGSELPDEIRGRDDRKAEAAEVLAAIRDLPDAYRETLILRLVEGMTGNEIAELTGLKPESVRVNLHRGMEMLRARLGIAGAGK
jgi:RNA polymerase sigma-70 factor, ECF subfamily